MNAICVFVALFAVAFAAEPIPLGPTPPLPEFPSNIEVLQVYPLPNPEEVSVDPTETFFLTGGNDGYMYKVDLETGDSEEVLTPRHFNPAAFEGMTDEEMRAFCNGEIPDEVTCGRILGIRFSQKSARYVYVANSYFGIYLFKFGRHGHNKLFQLVDKTGSFINDVLESGRYVFYTDSHTYKQRNAVPYAVMDLDAPQGSLNVYDKRTRQARCLVQGIFFANGIALSSDEKYLYVSETTAARIRKFNIETMSEEGFLTEQLPIYTDNIYVVQSESCESSSHSRWSSRSRSGSHSGSGSRSGRSTRGWGRRHSSSSSECQNDGTVLVPGYWRHPDLDNLLRDPAALETFLQTPPSYHLPLFQSWVRPLGVLLQVSEATGEVLKVTYDNTGKFLLAASAHKLSGENEYIIGSVFVPKAVRIRLLD